MTPKQLLQHMEVGASSMPPHWRGARGLFVLGSLEPVRITLIAQQVRALNLVYALACEERLLRGTRIAILGAGPAGLTAACAAAFLGAKVRVFEKEPRPMAVFCPKEVANDRKKQKSRRYVHPNAELWPEEGWAIKSAELPFLDWEAGTPDSIAKGFVEQISALPKERKFETFTNVRANLSHHVGSKWVIEFDGLTWSWSPKTWVSQRDRMYTPSESKTWKCDLVILAIGFGTDKGSNPSEFSKGYWEEDEKLWAKVKEITMPQSVLISGSGDGALIDAINSCLLDDQCPCPHEWLIEQLQGWNSLRRSKGNKQKVSNFEKELLRIEKRIIEEGSTPSEIWGFYEKLEKGYSGVIQNFDECLKLGQNKPRRLVYLATEDVRPLRGRAFLLNRFFVWRLIKREWIVPRVGKLGLEHNEQGGLKSVELEDTRIGGIGGSHTISNIGQVIARHGPKAKPLHQQYPELAAECERTILPRNQLDQTRIRCWPSNFFVPHVSGQKGPKHQSHNKADVIDIDSITLTVRTRPFGREGEARWTTSEFEIDVRFGKDLQRSLLLEHQITPTFPLRLRLLADADPRVKIHRLPGKPPWAVAYSIFGAKKNESVKLRLTGDPCGMSWIPDSVGFPIYSDMRVRRLNIRLTFENLVPIVHQVSTHGKNPVPLSGYVNLFRSSIRRLNYESGEDVDMNNGSGDKSNDSALQLRKLRLEGKHCHRGFQWLGAKKGNSTRHSLPSGYVYGVDWHRLDVA